MNGATTNASSKRSTAKGSTKCRCRATLAQPNRRQTLARRITFISRLIFGATWTTAQESGTRRCAFADGSFCARARRQSQCL
jgi:hypothetical protein